MNLSLGVRRSLVATVVVIGVIGFMAPGLTGAWSADSVFAVGGLMVMMVGALLVLRVPHNRVSWVMFGAGAGFALMSLAEVIPVQSTRELINGIGLFGLVLPGLGVLVPLPFPTGEPPSPSWRWVQWLVAAGALAILAGTAIVEWVELGDGGYIGSCRSIGTCVSLFGLGGVLISVVSAALSFIVRWRRSAGAERLQLRWLVPALLVLAVGVLAEFGGFQDSLVATAFVATGLVLVPGAIGVAILRYRLYEIDRIISRTVSYALLAGVLGLVFGAGVVWIPSLVPGIDGSPLLVAGSTLAVAALFTPARRRIQVAVDRRFNRSRYDVERVMAEFADSLRDRIDPDGALEDWAEVVNETMQPASITIWVRSPEG